MKRPRGQGLVEFALILPVLLLILLGIIEAAFLIQGYLVVQHAAREAARFAVSYQPVQGACLDQDRDGVLEDGSTIDKDDRAPYPFCPVDGLGDAAETDSHYYARRVALIKLEARRAAAGLRVNDGRLGDTEVKYSLYKDEARFFGVRVWGYPSFQTDCNANPDTCLDHPGLEGLPVRVMVRHNVEIVDPLYRAIVEYVPVRADAQMINEGVQVGFGDVPPPEFIDYAGDPDEPPIPTATDDDLSTPETTEPPRLYYIDLNLSSVENVLPDDRGHEFVATVTDELSRTVQGARVSFFTDEGGFNYSGIEPTYVEKLTDGTGQASVTIYGNRPGVAHIRAWLDYDGDNIWDATEPYDEAIKTWTVSGPYITVSDHMVLPLDYVTIDVMDHDPGNDPYRLTWCVITGTDTSGVIQEQVDVDADGDATDLGFDIPQNSEGQYRIETHASGGDCGDADLVAYSGEIQVSAVPPDLHIRSISWPSEYGDELPLGVSIPFTMVVENLSPTPVEDTYFDVDYYLDPAFPPPFQGQMGNEKQWLLDIGSYGSQDIHASFELDPGVHQMWGQVDTTDYVSDEYDETNNVSGPYTVTVRCTASSSPEGDDFNDGSFAGKWTTSQIGSSIYGSVSESGGRLTISARGSSIWGDSDNFYYVHQSISGDFDARLRVMSVPSYSEWSKMGLMVRNGTASNSRHVMMLETRSHGIQSAYREEDGGDTYRAANDVWASVPVWVRIVRSGDTFAYYYSTAQDPGEDNWTYRASVTVDMDDSVQVGIAHATYSSWSTRSSQADEFVVCKPIPVPDPIRPPGLLECQQVLHVGSFEGNPETVFAPTGYWYAGGPLAFKHQSRYFYEGSMSLRLHASMGSYPECRAYSPYLWQEIQIPSEVYTMTTLVVRGRRLVAGSLAPCSRPDTPESDDVLYLQMQDNSGTDLGSAAQIANGGAAVETWGFFEEDVTDEIDLYNRANQTVRVRFYATHDEDYDDTWFYLDGLEAEVCTGWPAPPEEPGTVSIGGEVRVLVSGIPRSFQGVDVWAYSPGGEVYHTATIHDGTYHFYNVPPGVYTVYSEIWIGGGIRFATTTVALGAGERNYDVNLFLL